MVPSPKILLIYTGGTIGMMRDFDTGALKNLDFDDLLSHIPELKLLDCAIDTVSFENPIDSSNIGMEHWRRLCELIESHYESHDGFVILHGSDTMSYTASALSFMLENLSKAVILTGSQLPIGDLRTDGKENLITAVQLASMRYSGGAYIQEVGLYFEYKLYRGNRSTKVNAENFRAFASPNYPPLAVSGVRLNISDHLLLRNKGKRLKVHKNGMNSKILIIHLFPSMDAELYEDLICNKKVTGILLKTFGAGNASTAPWFLKCLKEKIETGIPVVNITQCDYGSVQMGNYETSSGLKNLGVISGADLTTEAAVSKMMYLLGQELTPQVFKTIFETAIRGEMS